MGKFHIKSGPKVLGLGLSHICNALSPDGNKVNPTSAQCVVESIQSLNFRSPIQTQVTTLTSDKK